MIMAGMVFGGLGWPEHPTRVAAFCVPPALEMLVDHRSIAFSSV
jgi:hypothetical protein